MKLDIKKEQGINLYYSGCPRCHSDYNLKKNKRTKHHVIPQFMEPKTEVVITICLSCHEELNSYYNRNKIVTRNFQYETTTFTEFMKVYEDLKERFERGEINRSEFGAGLWSNLVSYLRSTQK